jgi:hypothetical protein
MSKFFSFESKSSQDFNSFSRISIFLDLCLWIEFQNSILKLFQTLCSNLFDLNPWPISIFLSLRNFKNIHSNSNFIWIYSFQPLKIWKLISYSFLQFRPKHDASHPIPLWFFTAIIWPIRPCGPAKPTRVNPLLLPPVKGVEPPPPCCRCRCHACSSPAAAWHPKHRHSTPLPFPPFKRHRPTSCFGWGWR